MKDSIPCVETILSNKIAPDILDSNKGRKKPSIKKRTVGLRVIEEQRKYIQKSKVNLTYFLQKCTEQLYLELVNRNNLSEKAKEIKG